MAKFQTYCSWVCLLVGVISGNFVIANSAPHSFDRAALAAEMLPDLADFPRRPIRITVYTSPGGLIDFTARKFAEIARLYHPQHPYVVVNRPGGGGIVAFEEVLRVQPDGYNMLAVTRSNISKLVASGRADLIDRIDWHSYVMDNPHVIIVNTREGLHSWQDVDRDARARDGRQLWLGVDIGGVKHVSGVKIADAANLEMRWIPYSSGGQAVAALMGGLGSVYFGNPRDAQGRQDLRVVAVAGKTRLADFPDAPTFTELGIDGLEHERIWRGFAFANGVPESVRDWHEAMMRLVTSDPLWLETWENEGVELEFLDSAVFTEIVQSDREEFLHYLGEMGFLRKSGGRSGLLSGIGEAPAAQWLKSVLLVLNILLAWLLLRSAFRSKWGELMVLSLVFSLAVLFFILTEGLPEATRIDTIGPRGIPRLWIYLMIPLAMLQTYLILRDKKERKAVGSVKPWLLFVFIGTFACYLFLLPVLGYLLATAIYIPVVLWNLKYRHLLSIAAITCCWLLFSQIIFVKLLHVDLPGGLLARLLAMLNF
jgi:putative tricarboxylic transport membrane protein